MSEDKLKGAFKSALGVSGGLDFASLEYRGIKEWDSLAHMALIAEIEGTFDVMLDTEDVLGMSSYQRAKEILAKHGVSFDA